MPARPTPPSLEAVARAARVSKATASLALNHRPGPASTTRRAVLAAAARLGYRPNPLITAYQAHVRNRRTPAYQANLAWVNDNPERDFWYALPWTDGYIQGARDRARELGFQLEEVHVGDHAGTPLSAAGMRRLAQVLRHRGICGLILPWLMFPELADQEWTDFSVAMIGRNTHPGPHQDGPLDPPFFHHVNPDAFHNLRLAWNRMRLRGRRRIGLVLNRGNDLLGDTQQRSCYLVLQSEISPRDRLPALLLPDDPGREILPTFWAWFDRHEPDAVLLYHGTICRELERRHGDRVAVVQLNLTRENPAAFGIDTRHPEIGAAAVDLVVSQLHTNERGRPRNAREVLIKGHWRETPGRAGN